jgi:hypothetical protein
MTYKSCDASQDLAQAIEVVEGSPSRSLALPTIGRNTRTNLAIRWWTQLSPTFC